MQAVKACLKHQWGEHLMRIFYTTPDFEYKGKSCQGIPFLCNDDMEFVSVVNDYLLWVSLENANTARPATWKSYAETLYDYFSWLHANKLEWNTQPEKGPHGEEISNIAMYRNWSANLVDPQSGKIRIEASTIRKRISLIISFYRWAVKRGRIATLPWEESFRIVTNRELYLSMYRHTRSVRMVNQNDIRPKINKKPIPFLQLDQCRSLLKACGTDTLQLMTKLMLQSGLRNEECRTFPRKYVFDPLAQNQNQRISINLLPSDMKLKGGKFRRIYVSWQLMKELFDYLNFGEGAKRTKFYHQIVGTKSPLAFLNHDGHPWSEKGLNNSYRKLWAPEDGGPSKLGFRVTPHMLRHTFATLELYAESQRKNVGEALAWVRDRLGHTSINATTVYVHCLDLMGEADLNIYQREIDTLMLRDDNGKA